MLPDAHRLPTKLLQGLVYYLISKFVTLELSLPKKSITVWNLSMIGTSVPKTSIDKNRDTQLGKNEIGSPENPRVAAPTDKTSGAENFD
jgi:hypothetical protein